MSHQLDVDGPALRQAVAHLWRLTKKQGVAQVALSYDGELVIDLALVKTGVAASGTWPDGRVVLPGTTALGALAKTRGAVASLTLDEGLLRVDGVALAYHLEAPDVARVALPLNATLAERIALSLVNDPRAIDDAGLRTIVDAGIAEYSQALAKAATALAPLGITLTELRTLVDASIIRRYGAKSG